MGREDSNNNLTLVLPHFHFVPNYFRGAYAWQLPVRLP